MKGSEADKLRVRHILDAISEVEGYLNGINNAEFLASSEKRYATIKQIEIIGEACNRLSEDFKATHPQIPWKPINGFRNISIHEYFGVNFHIVWEIATINLPEFKAKFSAINAEFKD
jgi:uncharacterized protein with HEPN domain